MPTLLASAARTVDGAGDWISLPTGKTGGVFQLRVTAAATEVGDLLDVYVQHSVDGGTTAQDFIRFTQVLGNGGAKTYIAHWVALMTPTSAMHAPQDGAM